MTDKLLTSDEVAALLRVKPDTLRIWRYLGDRGPAFVKVGSAVRYRQSDVDAWLRSRTVDTSASNVRPLRRHA